MQSLKIPIIKSGWLYLWLFVMVIGFVSEHKGSLNNIESANLSIWPKVNATKGNESKLIRLLDLNLDIAPSFMGLTL
jgi:hypothetical protein